MLANIQRGGLMISDLCTYIGFFSLLIVKFIDVQMPLDCLGF